MNEKYSVEVIRKMRDNLISAQSEINKGKRVHITILMDFDNSNDCGDIKRVIINSIKEEYKNFDLTILECDENGVVEDGLALLKDVNVVVSIIGYTESNVDCNHNKSNITTVVNIAVAITIPIEINK